MIIAIWINATMEKFPARTGLGFEEVMRQEVSRPENPKFRLFRLGAEISSAPDMTGGFPAAEQHAAQQAQQDADNDEGGSGGEGKTDGFVEEDHTHDGGGQGLNRVECRAVACRKDSESLIPQNISNTGAQDTEI